MCVNLTFMLDPTQLRLLHLVDRHGSLAAVAREVGVSAPAITQQLARLERAVAAPLVERGPRGARLTPLGSDLAQLGEDVERSLRLAHDLVGASAEERRRRLHVGALSSTIRPVVAEALANVRLRHSDAELSVVETGSQDGVQGVHDGRFDIAIVADYGQIEPAPGVELHHLSQDPLLLVVPSDHALASSRERVDLRALAGDAWVSGAPGRQHRVQLDAVAARFGVEPVVAFETESFEVALAVVAVGMGVALVPGTAYREEPGTVCLRVQGEPTRDIVAAVPERGGHLALLGPMLRAVRETARQFER